MSQEIMRQHELTNSIKQQHHQRELQIELDTVLKEKKNMDMDKVTEYLNSKKLKEERRREIQDEINRK